MAISDTRTHKVSKRTKERKNSKNLDSNALADLVGMREDESNETKSQDKRPSAIVIDGKTYTCATCKAGHRVGVCKHGRERPMKATHPPGRPPAGAPKKIVCDCPKNCGCSKKDCKCARKCNCTQIMYMLVYIPAPGEDENGDNENGLWKLGEQVTTDLKGNVLTPEEVDERQKKKNALKSTGGFETHANQTVQLLSPRQEQVDKPEISNCCKHKENVATRNISAKASSAIGAVSKSPAEGCNCGHTCSCAFCPQHPNNSISMNVAREQAMHFANHPSTNDQSIVAFLPSVPQSMSCMGGQPRFAMSKHADRPSFEQLQTMFPNPGYVIGYPVWPVRNDHVSIAPLHTTNVQTFMDPLHLSPAINPMTAPPIQFQSTSLTGVEEPSTSYDFAQEDFGIGNAFVASAGTTGWQNQDLPVEPWDFNTAPFPDPTAYLPPNEHHEIQTQQFSDMSRFTSTLSQDMVEPQLHNVPDHAQSHTDIENLKYGATDNSPLVRTEPCCKPSPLSISDEAQTFLPTQTSSPLMLEIHPRSKGIV